MNWCLKPFNELSLDELYDILKARVDVFVTEQACAYSELDNKDRHPEVKHFWCHDQTGKLMAYVRILPPGLSYPQASIGRVLVVEDARGKGLAQELMQKAVEHAQTLWPEAGIQIGAQLYLNKFYSGLGFENASEEYLEDGIPHVDMILGQHRVNHSG
ncbi:GNAT family N-acetyltransferase [Shewanella submarina]|uniref:GNAT family N-acetyltransferase n=1 Tax=Shewanella submarina TaxID=2016376 RepID=A0ABV7G9C1_9GAMM|nr:GNAT family N-acetyltransferase [Shewanella submarina]MCL1038321.1 GNAT family N-acetyltransferase [Shewanella submarina]